MLPYSEKTTTWIFFFVLKWLYGWIDRRRRRRRGNGWTHGSVSKPKRQCPTKPYLFRIRTKEKIKETMQQWDIGGHWGESERHEGERQKGKEKKGKGTRSGDIHRNEHFNRTNTNNDKEQSQESCSLLLAVCYCKASLGIEGSR